MADQNPGVYEDGDNITVYAATAVVSKTFVAITGNRYVPAGNAGPGPALQGPVSVGTAPAGGRIVGVASTDIAAGKVGTVHRSGGRVTYVTTGAAVTAFAEVEVGANGLAVPQASGKAVGYALTGAASGADAEISLYY